MPDPRQPFKEEEAELLRDLAAKDEQIAILTENARAKDDNIRQLEDECRRLQNQFTEQIAKLKTTLSRTTEANLHQVGCEAHLDYKQPCTCLRAKIQEVLK